MSPTLRLMASFVALMMAMGIGRFALTPQLPHLVGEGQLSLTAAGLVAAANYLGYLLGALDAMFARSPRQIRLRLDIGLWLCVLLTLVSYEADGFVGHALLRFGTGVASAWVLVMITSLTQPLAAHHNLPRLGALVFAGPGLGIMLTGLLALLSNLYGLGSAPLWLIYAAAALVMLLAVRPLLPRPEHLSDGRMVAGPGCRFRATQGDQLDDLGLQVTHILVEDRLMVRDPVAKPVDRPCQALDLVPADRRPRMREDDVERRAPEGVVFGSEQMRPEVEGEFRDNLPPRCAGARASDRLVERR